MGLRDAYCKAGSYEWLLEQYGLTAKGIADGIDSTMND
jgi:transketolase C-terminal domain/subunit